MDAKKRRKFLWNILLFLGIMFLTFYAVLRGQDPAQILGALGKMSPLYLGVAFLLGLFFVSAEGCMIWYLLRSVEGGNGSGARGSGRFASLPCCIGYSFIGFFFSGITPSATGGQPMQLLFMKKDGHSLSASSVVLMTVAVIYKFVLVLIGLAMVMFWRKPLKAYLGGYYSLYYLGLFLNTALVVILLCVMALPAKMTRLLHGLEQGLVRLHILKPSAARREKIDGFIRSYGEAVAFLWGHKVKVAAVVAFTFLQRCSVFALAYVVYRGFGLTGASALDVMFLQASVYIAVDMLPLPGSQGITELMYQSIFAGIYPQAYLMPSLYVTRGISFYFLLLVSLGVFLWNVRRSAFAAS